MRPELSRLGLWVYVLSFTFTAYHYRNCTFAQNCLVIHQKVELPLQELQVPAAGNARKLV